MIPSWKFGALFLCIASIARGASVQVPAPGKVRILVVDSYASDYLWSQETSRGFAQGMKEAGYFDDAAQIQEFAKSDTVQTSKAIFKKLWMNTKVKNALSEISKTTIDFMAQIRTFNPSLVFLGDDNATNYIGNQLIDGDSIVVFWGVNGTPLKYSLLDSIARPGHNVTGVYQKGYYAETIAMLRELVPKVRRFAILAEDSETARAKAKAIRALVDSGAIPLALVDTVITSSFKEWKEKALELRKNVDAFFVLNHSGLNDEKGEKINVMTVGRWYLANIEIPECSDERQFIQEGMLLTVDDSGFNQGYEAANLGAQFLSGAKQPATTTPIAPKAGPRLINLQRLNQLKLTMGPTFKVDEVIEHSLVFDGR